MYLMFEKSECPSRYRDCLMMSQTSRRRRRGLYIPSHLELPGKYPLWGSYISSEVKVILVCILEDMKPVRTVGESEDYS
jgi:hypothetical protein